MVGIIDGEYKSIWGFGKSGDSSSNVPNGDTIFEIGSITKVFTATFLSLLIEKKQIELKTPIKNLKKEYEHISENITIEKLATHTSGLPRLPNNFINSENIDVENPYKLYTSEDLDTATNVRRDKKRE